MQASVLERPVTLETSSQYCHIVCTCAPRITLCGAYKEHPCGVNYVASRDKCPICEKALCIDCEELVFEPCMRCGA